MTEPTKHKYIAETLVNIPPRYGCDYGTIVGRMPYLGDDPAGGPLYIVNVGNVFGDRHERIIAESELSLREREADTSWGESPPSTLVDVGAALLRTQQELRAVMQVHDEQKHDSDNAVQAWSWAKRRLEILQGALAAADVVFDVTVEFLEDEDELDVIRQYKAARTAVLEAALEAAPF